MAVKQVLKVSRKTFFNPRAWMGYDSLKEDSKTIWTTVIDLFAPPAEVAPEEVETFDQAKERLQLSEKDIKNTQENYFYYALFFFATGTLILMYAFYLIFRHHLFWSWLLALSVSALFYANAFRYHFWYFQIKHRKLGCTFAEWRSGKIN